MQVIPWDGKPITKPGIYSGIPLRTYHSAEITGGEPSVSSSNLRTAWSESMAHMYDAWCCNPDRAEMEPSEAMTLGSATHHLFLGEDDWARHFVQQPLDYRDKKTGELKKWTYAAGYCKDWRAAQEEKGREIVTLEQLERIRGMARSLKREPLVEAGILEGIVECSGFVRDAETGLWIRVRPDVLPTSSGNYVDLKTAREVSNVAIYSAIRSSGYHMQGGLIWDFCEQMKLPFEDFTLIFLESSRPFCTRVVPVDDDDISRGRLQCRAMMRRIAHCIETGHWPGPGEGENRKFGLPKEERERVDALLQKGGPE